jgi:cystathionine beta-lyase
MTQRLHSDTELIAVGRSPERFGGFVNTPIFRGSTILAESFDAWESGKQADNPYAMYGRFGSPTTRALEEAVARLEGGYRSLVFPSGLSACTHTLLCLLGAGDHALIADNVYGPTRAFADGVLARLGIEVEYFDPLQPLALRSLLKKNTRVVYLESPGSLTLEITDIPAVAQLARTVGAKVVLDNTWATPLYFKPFEKGVDISIQAATKYLVGHSDALLGVATCNEASWPLLKAGAHHFGQTAGPEDMFLALRGIRTLAVRLERHQSSALQLAQRLLRHPAIEQVIHPGLPNHPQHALWQRDFLGASGLFSMVLKPVSQDQLRLFFDSLRLFGIGLSWGGYESLVVPVGCPARTTRAWPSSGYLVRVHAGLENVDELWADFEQALAAMAGAERRRAAVSVKEACSAVS